MSDASKAQRSFKTSRTECLILYTEGTTLPRNVWNHSPSDTTAYHKGRESLCVFNEVQPIDELQTLPFLVKYTFYVSYWKFAKTSHSNRHLPHRTPKLFSYCHCLCFHRQFQARYMGSLIVDGIDFQFWNRRNWTWHSDTIIEFNIHLNNENWESVLKSCDVDWKLNTYPSIYKDFARFPTTTDRVVF